MDSYNQLQHKRHLTFLAISAARPRTEWALLLSDTARYNASIDALASKGDPSMLAGCVCVSVCVCSDNACARSAVRVDVSLL